jgi:FMN-dependent NADH-azoreductase
MKLLHIDSSPLNSASASRALSRKAVAAWTSNHPATEVEYLDLAKDAPSHLNLDSLGFRLGSEATQLTPMQQRENEVSEKLVSQFLAADVIVIGAPMYNFSVPSQLKAWVDRILQAGRTFKYTETGPVGLAGGKTVIVISTRGGFYSGVALEGVLDHQESYLKTVFRFVGIDDVRIVRAEGLGMGAEAKARALAAAEDAVRAEVIRAQVAAAGDDSEARVAA